MTKKIIMRRIFRLVAILFISAGLGTVDGHAQVSVGSPPPTYDYVPGEPGTQPPTTLGGPFTARELFTHSLRVGVFVPLAELQALLPPGFLARPFPAGSNTAVVNLQFNFQTRLERPGVGPGFGNFGPSTTLQIDTSVVNPENVVEGFYQLVHLASDEDGAVVRTSVFGPGSSRVAALKFEIEEEEGSLRVEGAVKDKELGLDLRTEAKGPSIFANRFGGNLARSRFQNQYNPATVNGQALTVVFGDNAGAQPAANVSLSTNLLRLPGGELHVIAIAGFTFVRNLETFYRIP